MPEQKSPWKTFAEVAGALAGLIAAIAGLLQIPQIRELVSGSPRPPVVEVLPGPPPPPPIIYEFNVDRPGMEIATLRVGKSDHRACDEACLKRPDCTSYVYVKPDVFGPDALCNLKNGLPFPVPDKPCCVSGIVRDRVPKPLQTPAPRRPR